MISKIKFVPFLLKEYWAISHFENWSKEKIEKYQLNAFQKIFESAKKIPFYKELYENAGVLDAKINSLEDLKKLPVIDKALCRKNGYEDFFMDRDIPGSLITSTSGSTGKPFHIRIPERTEMTPSLKVIHAMKHFGWRPLMKGLEIWREDTSTHKNFMRKMGLLRSVSIFKPLEEMKTRIETENPDYLNSSKSYLMALADYLEEKGVNLRLKFLLCSLEELSEGQRNRLESFFHTKLINVYGCMEAPTIGYSCPEHNQMHIFQTTVIVELINQRFIEGEQYGDIAITNLTNNIMPFIRYQTGDVVKMSEYKCKCQRNSQIIGNIYGRNDNVIITSEGRVFSFHPFYCSFRSINFIDQYKIIYYKQENLLEFVFKLKTKENNQENIELLNDVIKNDYADVKYKVKIVDRIQLSDSGKFKLIEIVES